MERNYSFPSFYVTWFCFFLLVYGDRAQRGSSFPLFSLIFPPPKNKLIRFSRSHVKDLAQLWLNFSLCSFFPSVEMTFPANWYDLHFWPLQPFLSKFIYIIYAYTHTHTHISVKMPVIYDSLEFLFLMCLSEHVRRVIFHVFRSQWNSVQVKSFFHNLFVVWLLLFLRTLWWKNECSKERISPGVYFWSEVFGKVPKNYVCWWNIRIRFSKISFYKYSNNPVRLLDEGVLTPEIWGLHEETEATETNL